MTDGLKERPALLRRKPRPAADELVDPVDYTPGMNAPKPIPPAFTEPTVQGPKAVEHAAHIEATPEATESAAEPVAQAPQASALTQALETPARTTPEEGKTSAKAAPAQRRSNRREVTFPMSTRLSQEVLDILYQAVDDEEISVREAVEQAIRARWASK